MKVRRKDAQARLKSVGVDNRFSLRTVHFCRTEKQVATIKDCNPETSFAKILDLMVDWEPQKGLTLATSLNHPVPFFYQ